MEIKFDDSNFKYSDNLKNLVMRLLERDPNKRIGQESKGDYLEILAHPVFNQTIKNHVSLKTFKATISPQLYDLSQDFDTMKH